MRMLIDQAGEQRMRYMRWDRRTGEGRHYFAARPQGARAPTEGVMRMKWR
jgi:hypothetical protein